MAALTGFFHPIGSFFGLLRAKAKGFYQWGWDVVHASTRFNDYTSDRHKLSMILANPAVLKVFALQCDLFSMGRLCVKDAQGMEIENDPFLEMTENPNPFTKTRAQFLWDFMFWNMLGTSYNYVESKVVDNDNILYFLDPSRIVWPQSMINKQDKLIFSKAEINALNKTMITYRYEDGTQIQFPFDRLVISFDLTNSIGNFFKGPSRIDALYKIISNSEFVLDSDNINIRYSAKFMVASENQTGTNNRMAISDEERNDIINKMDGPDKNVFPLRAKASIQRFVDNMANLQLSEKYLQLYFLIGNMYNIPRDVLEAFNSSTYENQEKARAAHVNYTLQPKAEQWMDSYEMHFGYRKDKKSISISWDHLPFMQIIAKEAAECKKLQIENLNSLLSMGVPIKEANEYVGTTFTIEKPEPVTDETETEGTTDETGSGGSEESQGGENEETKRPRNGQQVNGRIYI